MRDMRPVKKHITRTNISPHITRTPVGAGNHWSARHTDTQNHWSARHTKVCATLLCVHWSARHTNWSARHTKVTHKRPLECETHKSMAHVSFKKNLFCYNRPVHIHLHALRARQSKNQARVEARHVCLSKRPMFL